ncbi:MAG: hypothetical protein EKK63_11000 [Acinetobacter sp.]|uniref:hypothetical protein n=1 Tax=Acinetobacter sp. TaxID=472 RepID=UPI000F94B472|nr:hypothetical protein [Acinetobacter sp.]RUP38894.1 MAG: hypothetical protein EKK63_11000 [Acinetobacter sp.]
MDKRLLPLEICTLGDEVNFISTWHNCMREDLVFAYNCANGILIILNEKDGVEKLASWIEEEYEIAHFNTLPLFIIWEDKFVVHEYAPFENGVRQLIKEYD